MRMHSLSFPYRSREPGARALALQRLAETIHRIARALLALGRVIEG